MLLRLSRDHFERDFKNFVEYAENFKEGDYSILLKPSEKKVFIQIPSEIELIISIKSLELKRLQMQYVGCVDGICSYSFMPVIEDSPLDGFVTRFISYVCKLQVS